MLCESADGILREPGSEGATCTGGPPVAHSLDSARCCCRLRRSRGGGAEWERGRLRILPRAACIRASGGHDHAPVWALDDDELGIDDGAASWQRSRLDPVGPRGQWVGHRCDRGSAPDSSRDARRRGSGRLAGNPALAGRRRTPRERRSRAGTRAWSACFAAVPCARSSYARSAACGLAPGLLVGGRRAFGVRRLRWGRRSKRPRRCHRRRAATSTGAPPPPPPRGGNEGGGTGTRGTCGGTGGMRGSCGGTGGGCGSCGGGGRTGNVEWSEACRGRWERRYVQAGPAEASAAGEEPHGEQGAEKETTPQYGFHADTTSASQKLAFCWRYARGSNGSPLVL